MKKLFMLMLCFFLVAASAQAGGGATSAEQENPRQAGKSSIYFYDVEATDTHGFGQLKIDVKKRTFVLIGKDFPPSVQINLQARQVESEDYVLFGSGKTTPSGQLSMHGTLTDASLNYLQEAQLRLTEPGFSSIMPMHKSIAAGSDWSLAITCAGDVYAWGDNYECQCGLAGSDNEKVPTPILLDKLWPDAVEVVGGQKHNLAVMSDGTVWAWGNNDNGQLGVNSNDGSCAPLQVHGPGDVGYLTGIIKVAAGESHSLALKSDGTLWAWGKGNPGQLGIHSDNDQPFPYQVHGPDNVGYLTDVVDVAAGFYHSLALKSDGTVYAWGEGGHGQLGIHSDNDHTIPYQVHGPGNVGYLTGIIKVAAGERFSLAVKEDGSLWAWGQNRYGQLGIHSDNDHTVPYQVHGPGNVGYLTDVVDVAAGTEHTLALKRDGTVYAWGLNGDGQLGIHSKDDHTVPYQVHGPNDVGYLTGIIEVAAGYYHSLALRDDGTVWAWGSNWIGQLGINEVYNSHTIPYQVHGPGNVGYLTEIGPTCIPPIDTP